MTFVEFIKSKLLAKNDLSDLANDILRDPNFPVNKTTNEIFEYLEYGTFGKESNEVFHKMKQLYFEYLLDEPLKEDFTETIIGMNSVLKSENWKVFKELFIVNQVYLVGETTDIYKAYCVNKKSGEAIFVDLKSNSDLNDLHLFPKEKIFNGSHSTEYSVNDAIAALENCPYETPIKPNPEKITELLSLLKNSLQEN